MNKQTILSGLLMIIIFTSCVPARQYQDAVTARDNCYTEKTNLEAQMKTKSDEILALNKTISNQSDTISRLLKDKSDIQTRYNDMLKANAELREIEDKLNNRINQLLALSANETQSLNEQLTKKEKELSDKEAELNAKAKTLEAQQKDIDNLMSENSEKQKRIAELEKVLSTLNQKLTDVAAALTSALSGFSSSDLTVEQKDGKIYVKMSEKLLFASGSAVVDAKGKTALKQIADALKQQQGIQIMVEGHTDNVPLKSANYPKDNWDLSVLRATSIVKILTQDYGMSSTNVEAAGRGEYMPVASNGDATGRATNRRTEIVIIPNQEEILQLLKELTN